MDLPTDQLDYNTFSVLDPPHITIENINKNKDLWRENTKKKSFSTEHNRGTNTNKYVKLIYEYILLEGPINS